MKIIGGRFKYDGVGGYLTPDFGKEDKNMKNENRNEEAVSPVIATILMVAITVVLAGVLYVWASSLAGDNTGGSLELYAFDADDATGSPTTGDTDDLIRVSMTTGSEINWAAISIKISIDKEAPVTCNAPGADNETIGCNLVEYGVTGDQVWSVGDGVTISESQDNLCDSTQPCSIEVIITDKQAGETLFKVTEIAA